MTLYLFIFIAIALLLIAVCIYNYFEAYFAKLAIIHVLNKFKLGNIVLVSDNNNGNSKGKESKHILLKKINDRKSPIVYVNIKNEDAFFLSVYSKSDLGLGESYMRGEWTTDNMPGFLTILALNINQSNVSTYNYLHSFVQTLNTCFSGDIYLNPYADQDNVYDNVYDDMYDDRKNIQHHYDVGNDFYLKFLKDDLSAYSCGFWFNESDTLNDAQYNKVNTIILKMAPSPGDKILDIGCGWGKIANYVANETGCTVTGITISDEQAKFATNNYDNSKVNILNMDYRKLHDIANDVNANVHKYDAIYSIGMFEHVRCENYDAFFQSVKKCLKPGGRFVLHTIIYLAKLNTSLSNSSTSETFLSKHIFPGGHFPYNDWITNAVIKNDLNIIHFEGFGGQHYAKTLKVWRENMMKERDYVTKEYGDELLKKYEYYFAICEAGFSTGSLGIGHYVITNEPIVSTKNSFNYMLL